MEKTSDTIPCKFCGEEIKATAIKCKHCGEFLKENNTPQQTPTINIVNQQNNNSGDSVNEKNWVVALLLAIFFGWAGFDRFYLGHGGLGVIKLLTGGLLGIMWFIDIILILTKSVGGIKWK